MAAYITVPLKGINYTASFLRKFFNRKTNFCRLYPFLQICVCLLANKRPVFFLIPPAVGVYDKCHSLTNSKSRPGQQSCFRLLSWCKNLFQAVFFQALLILKCKIPCNNLSPSRKKPPQKYFEQIQALFNLKIIVWANSEADKIIIIIIK